MEYVVVGINSSYMKVAAAAIRCLHSLSRSVQLLRTTFQDHAVWKPLMKVTNIGILHEFSFNINFYETSLWNVIKCLSGKLYNMSRTSFNEVYINKTMSGRFFFMEPPLDMISIGFSHVAYLVV